MRALCLWLTLAGWSTSAMHAQEVLHYRLPDTTWSVKPAKVLEQKYISAYTHVRNGQQIDSATEVVTLMNWTPRLGEKSARKHFEAERKGRDRECPGATQWEIIDENRSSILYEDITTGCGERSAWHQLVRLFFGDYNRWSLSYMTRGTISPETRDSVIQWLRGVQGITR